MRNNGVVVVSCAEQPRENADLFYKAACWNHQKIWAQGQGFDLKFLSGLALWQKLRRYGNLKSLCIKGPGLP